MVLSTATWNITNTDNNRLYSTGKFSNFLDRENIDIAKTPDIIDANITTE
jgi:hypothetical protein